MSAGRVKLPSAQGGPVFCGAGRAIGLDQSQAKR